MGTKENIEAVRADLDELEGLFEESKNGKEDKSAKGTVYEQVFKKIENTSSSLKGIVHGHLFEVQYALKHLKKGRRVILQRYADVSIGGKDEVFAKSVQFKSSYADTTNDVDTYLAKAAYQISGAKGETPRDNDRRVIDVAINHRAA